MPRPKKCRRVCSLPQNTTFISLQNQEIENTIYMSIDEYETIRLIDKEGFSQEECASYMGVARTTVQAIYTNARIKIAKVIVDGFRLQIEGGDYKICDGKQSFCNADKIGGCKKRRCNKNNFELKEDNK